MDTNTSSATETHRDQPGPAILNERSLLGIFVHLIALGFGVVGAGVIYLTTDHDFTKANARNALNWHLLLSTVFIAGLGLFLVAVVGDWAGLPQAVTIAPFLAGFILFALSAVMTLATFLFTLVATVKAIFGDAWWYPAPDLVARIGALVE